MHSIAPSVGRVLVTILLAISNLGSQAAEEPSRLWSVVAGANLDGSSDCTAVIQKFLDEAGRAGGTVHLPSGRYLVKGSLSIPPGVTLQGVMESPVWSEPLKGSIILATGGCGKEDAPALFEMNHSSAVRGLTVWYPEQQTTQHCLILLDLPFAGARQYG
jgi:pectate lyase-like protein